MRKWFETTRILQPWTSAPSGQENGFLIRRLSHRRFESDLVLHFERASDPVRMTQINPGPWWAVDIPRFRGARLVHPGSSLGGRTILQSPRMR